MCAIYQVLKPLGTVWPTRANSSQVVLLLLDGCVVVVRQLNGFRANWLYLAVPFGHPSRRCKFWFCNLVRVGLSWEYGLARALFFPPLSTTTPTPTPLPPPPSRSFLPRGCRVDGAWLFLASKSLSFFVAVFLVVRLPKACELLFLLLATVLFIGQ